MVKNENIFSLHSFWNNILNELHILEFIVQLVVLVYHIVKINIDSHMILVAKTKMMYYKSSLLKWWLYFRIFYLKIVL